LGTKADSADQAALGQEKQQLDSLASQFKQVSAAAIPLSKQGILLDLYQKSLANWDKSLRDRRMAEVKGLAIRLGFLALTLGIVVGAAEVWRRAVHRYVHDPRRRYQFLLMRKFVMWFVISVIVAFAFASRLGSVVTFAGLITAGVAVALQNVILAVVGYFFLIGKYGIRVGDRVQIGSVMGEVIDIGLVRLHLMELNAIGEYVPTGRVVAFSNSVVFQPSAGLFKQVPGTNFLWHEITLMLSPDTDFEAVKERLLAVVDGVLADYREDMEGQYRAIRASSVSFPPDRFRPKAVIRFTASAIEVSIRFPVDRQLASEIDERITRELMRNVEREPKLHLANTESPSITVRTDLAVA
jgi:small-conductance mechanosensitive channel